MKQFLVCTTLLQTCSGAHLCYGSAARIVNFLNRGEKWVSESPENMTARDEIVEQRRDMVNGEPEADHGDYRNTATGV